MVGPGLGYRGMLTGPHIVAREEKPQEVDLEATDSF